jgi:hypothetical protein
MSRFPSCFVPVSRIAFKNEFSMPRYLEPDIEVEREEALTAGLNGLQWMWKHVYPADRTPHWRDLLLQHLRKKVKERMLEVRPELIAELVARLSPSPIHRCIHGDSTLANILRMPGEIRLWFWIDPLACPYIPNDPRVDLGKLFQSCYDYERVLAGLNEPVFDEKLAKKLATSAYMSFKDGWNWMLVHLIRLLPYQDERVRAVYEKVLREARCA